MLRNKKKKFLKTLFFLVRPETYQSTLVIRGFLIDLVKICDKRILKKNTLFIHSEPNAGKNYFFDTVIHYFLNFGQLGNFNKHTSFPMQECVNKRIILWNEPNMEPAAEDTLKMILGGDTTNAKIKYGSDAIIQRTPVIVLSNGEPFPNNNAFTSRIIRYNWIPCPGLKFCGKKPYPLAFYHLLQKYNILNDIEENNI